MAANAEGYRGDVDGLRAVAIVAVVAFHAGIAGFGGGFVGVDVFFVISGFLITRQLVDEVDVSGAVGLAGFWARRIRRLVPSLALMVVVTLVASTFVLAPVDVPEVGRQGLAAGLYLANLLFARESGDYFGADLEASPFLHTWSLGVEEQFYVLWPLLVVALGAVSARRFPRRAVLAAGFVVVAVTSIGLSVWQTPRSPSWAFYGLHTRAWEFALAGLVALVPAARWARLPSASVLALGWLGIGAIGWAVATYDATTAYPGTAALVPVLGTVALLVAGSVHGGRKGTIPSLLDVAPLRWVGRVSYSWYLWHWPAIVLVVAAVDDATVALRAGVAVASLAVAAAVHHLVENPLRFSPALSGHPRRTFAAGGAMTLLVVVVATLAPRLAPVEDRDLEAELAAARADRGRDECTVRERSSSGVEHCVSGDPGGALTVMLVGDSHARHWKVALGEAAAHHGARLVDHWHPRCPAVGVVISPPGGGGLDHELVASCLEHREETRQLLRDLEPDVVVVSDSRGYLPLVLTDEGDKQPRAEQAELWGTRFEELLGQIEAVGAVPAVVHDNPRLPEDPVSCLSAADDPTDCEPPAEEALDTIAELDAAERTWLERRAVDRLDVPTFSVTEDICGGERCVVRDRGALVWADQNHFTTAFTLTRTAELEDFLGRALALAQR